MEMELFKEWTHSFKHCEDIANVAMSILKVKEDPVAELEDQMEEAESLEMDVAKMYAPPEIESEDFLQEILPPENQYSILEAFFGLENTVVATFQVNLFNEEEATRWLRRFEERTYTTYTVKTTRPTTGTYVAYKCYFKCQHNTRSRRKLSDDDHNMKNTCCPAKLTMTIKAIHKRWKGKGTQPDPSLPCTVELNFNHNHALRSAAVLRFRPVGDAVKAKLLDLFRRGHTAASALETHRADIRSENDDYEEILGDRKFCPDYGSCHRLYKEFSRTRGEAERKATRNVSEEVADGDANLASRVVQADADRLAVPIQTTRAESVVGESGQTAGFVRIRDLPLEAATVNRPVQLHGSLGDESIDPARAALEARIGASESQRARGEEAVGGIAALLLGFLNDAPEAIEPALQRAREMLGKATTTASRVTALMTLGCVEGQGSRLAVQQSAVVGRTATADGTSDGGRPRTANSASAAATKSRQGRPQKRKTPEKLSAAKKVRLEASKN